MTVLSERDVLIFQALFISGVYNAVSTIPLTVCNIKNKPIQVTEKIIHFFKKIIPSAYVTLQPIIYFLYYMIGYSHATMKRAQLSFTTYTSGTDIV